VTYDFELTPQLYTTPFLTFLVPDNLQEEGKAKGGPAVGHQHLRKKPSLWTPVPWRENEETKSKAPAWTKSGEDGDCAEVLSL
jgi:hypothetical protein